MSRTPGRCLLACAIALLGACWAETDAPQQASTATIRPVKTFIVSRDEREEQRSFPARIESSNRADLSFRVPGTVVDVLVREGDMVARDTVLARLDDTDFRIELSDREASHESARRNFDRARELLPKGHISRLDYDRIETAFKSADAALRRARLNLAYTTLKAPFAGSIARRMVQRYEDVAPKQPVITLQQLHTLEVKIDLPERLLRRVDAHQVISVEEGASETSAWVGFDGTPGKRIALELVEVATRANPQTQTYEFTFRMAAPGETVVLPGMSATVTVDLSRLLHASPQTWIPASAATADAGLEPIVWVLDPATMEVRQRRVQLGEMRGGRVRVVSGLHQGEEIVAVGTTHMADGTRVSRMPSSEQALPRDAEID